MSSIIRIQKQEDEHGAYGIQFNITNKWEKQNGSLEYLTNLYTLKKSIKESKNPDDFLAQYDNSKCIACQEINKKLGHGLLGQKMECNFCMYER